MVLNGMDAQVTVVFVMQGKVVFVAPTKPLVNQQIQACYEFMGVSKVGAPAACVNHSVKSAHTVAWSFRTTHASVQCLSTVFVLTVGMVICCRYFAP